MRRILCISLFFLWGGAGCCVIQHSQPNLPQHVRGWQETTIDNGIVSVAELVLKKGASSDTGKFAIELVEVIPTKKCFFGEPAPPPLARLRFYRLSDRKTLAEVTASKSSGTRLVDYEIANGEYGITAVFINEINTVDGWVWINLWR